MTDELRRKLARRLAAKRKLAVAGHEVALPLSQAGGQTIPVAPVGTALPLSHAQERMWFLHQLDPAASAYNVCVLWHLRGGLNKGALLASVDTLIARHSILRTLYSTDDAGRGCQRVLSHLPAQWGHEDLRALEGEAQASQLKQIAQQASTAPFDLATQSALRLVLVAMTETHHVLVMVGQHVVWDGPSFGVFSRELAVAYDLHQAGLPDQRPPVPVQYLDFANWHRRQWQGPSAQRSSELAFWKTRLAPLPEPLNFPVDFERAPGNDEAGAWCTEHLDTQTTAALTALAAGEQVTPFVVLISAIAVLMTRLARASEVTIGTVASHRSLPELQAAMGNFGNVVPLRIAVSGDWSFRELLRRCGECCQASFAHADIPFECLLDHFQIARGEGSSPLLDTMVTFLGRGMEAPTMNGLEVHWEKHFNGTSQIDLSFDALLMHGTLQLQATWRRALYRPQTVQHHLRRLAKLLRDCVAQPDVRLGEHCILLPQERVQLTEQWGRRSALPAAADTLVGWFEQTAERYGQRTAVCGPSGQGASACPGLTFAELNTRANRLARWLVAQGVGPEDRVALVLPRRAEWFVAMLATLKAGAAFVPIDPAYPAEYIECVLQEALPALRLGSGGEAECPIAEGAEPSVALWEAEAAAGQAGLPSLNLSAEERLRPLNSGHPACVVFTSGSSGKPKGVVVRHAGLVNLLSSHRRDLYEEAYRLTGRLQLRVGHAWSLAFDAAWQPTLWMFEGHEVHLFDTDVMQDPVELARQISHKRLDFIELTPGMLEEVLPWLQAGLTEADGTHVPGHVPAILGFGGEAVKQALWERIASLEGTAGFNLYGPTEATVDAMIARAAGNQPPNIGGPVAGAQVYVLDACLQLSPPGVAGELAIGGAGLARGYLAREDLTARQFIANPFGEPGSRLYRTGDRVRWLPHGGIEYLGRIDEQVKIRGFRVEPLEVEAHVEKLVGDTCAVVARAASGGDMQLVCFVETAAVAPAFDADALRRQCTGSLPAHLVPKYFVPVPRMPRLPNGKVDRRALKMPSGLEAKQGRGPRTTEEAALCRLFADVLGKAQVGIDDGFFESGGDSITVVKLVSQARRKGFHLTARQVFAARTVAGLSAQLTGLERSAAATGVSSGDHDPGDIGSASPTPLMLRYLLAGQPLQRFAQIVTMPLPPGLSEGELGALLDAVIRRHGLLRARLVESGAGRFELVVTEASGPQSVVPTYRLASSRRQTGDLTAAQIARVVCEQLDPPAGRMLAAARLVGLGDGGVEHLCLAVHHLVVDAGSWHVLAGDLELARAAQLQGEPIELPPVPTAWRSWSAAQGGNNRPSAEVQPPLGGSLAVARRQRWVLRPVSGRCPAAMAARRLGLPVASVLPALTALAAARAGLAPVGGVLGVVVEGHGREPSGDGQDLSRTVGWFARELWASVPLSTLVSAEAPDQVQALLRKLGGAITQLHSVQGRVGEASEGVRDAQVDWRLGFNFLGDLGAAQGADKPWTPQPRLDWLAEACGEHWPLLHELDVSAHYGMVEGERVLLFDALSAVKRIDQAALAGLFEALQSLLSTIVPDVVQAAGRRLPGRGVSPSAQTREVTPLQYEMLRHCQGALDPWTTQMELLLAATPDQPLSASALQRGAAELLARHDALRAGFARDGVSTFVAAEVAPGWEALDWRGETPEQQAIWLQALRARCYQTPFQLDKPPLLRFAAVQLSDEHWHLLLNCHHLLLDGWSVPRALRDWLGSATGLPAVEQPRLSWCDYLDWLQSVDRGPALAYWNRVLSGRLPSSLLRPGRVQRCPSKHVYDALDLEQSVALGKVAARAGYTESALYQLAWAQTLAEVLGQDDVVFGLFDSGRAVGLHLDGLESLVGLVTQLVPVRLDGRNTAAGLRQLKALQGGQLEWQSLAPVRLDNLEAHSGGEFFDTLLVVENALTADGEVGSRATAPFAVLQGQSYQDSVGHVAALFVYPGGPIELRLCYDPEAIASGAAQQLLGRFKWHLGALAVALGADARVMQRLSPNVPRRLSPIPVSAERRA